MADREWTRVRKGNECPVCGGTSWCSIGKRGTHCMRVESPHALAKGGWFHPNGSAPPEPAFREPPVRKPTDTELSAKFGPIARAAFVKQAAIVEVLAKQLGVAAWALDELCCGYYGGAWTFPERNGAGLIVGVATRYRDGSKCCMPGSRRGLTYSEAWESNPGPVLVVEGASDVAAGITMGLATIGRPSNVGGVKYLTRLLGPHGDRRVVVIGERDAKRHDELAEVVRSKHKERCNGCSVCWPGLHGMVSVSRALTRALGRVVRGKLLPHGAKDLRAYWRLLEIDPEKRAEAFEAGRKLLRELRA